MHFSSDGYYRQTLPLRRNTFAIVVTEREISNQFMLTVFRKSVVLRTKMPFNQSETIRTVARKFSTGWLYVSAGGLHIENLVKLCLVYSLSYFNLGDLVFCWWG